MVFLIDCKVSKKYTFESNTSLYGHYKIHLWSFQTNNKNFNNKLGSGARIRPHEHEPLSITTRPQRP